MIPKFRVFVDEKIREVYAVKWNEDWCFVMIDYGGGLVKTFPADGVKLMQFTWLFDKNGKEIYEEDIVKFKDKYYGVYRDEEYLEYYLMNWEDNEPMYSYADYEVIGNIYKNPELINR